MDSLRTRRSRSPLTLLTYRRDQVTYREGMPCGDQLIGGIIFCDTAAGRHAWIRRLFEDHWQHFNYFVKFSDVNSPYALQFGFASWVTPGCAHIIN